MPREKLKVAGSNFLYYRTCFGTEAGKKVLGDILIQSGYFDLDLETPEEIAIQNFGKYIVHNLGVNSVDNVDTYVQNLFNLPRRTNVEEKGNTGTGEERLD